MKFFLTRLGKSTKTTRDKINKDGILPKEEKRNETTRKH